MTNRIGVIYTENENELWSPIGLGAVYDENQTKNETVLL